MQIASEHMKRRSMSLVIRLMQTKTTVRHHCIPIGWLESDKRTRTNVGEDVEKPEFICCTGGNVK